MIRSNWFNQALLLLIVAILAYGLLIPFLGFYWDDWPVIFLAKAHQGAERTAAYLEFYTYDRPFSAWTYILSVPLLGVTPWRWQAFSLLLRWAGALAFYLGLRGLWPNREELARWSSVLFLVYPAFFQQFIAVAYSQHFITYLLFLSSLALMIWAQRRPEKFRLFTLIAVLLAPVHMLTMEYMAGLELIRLPVLWLLFRDEPDGRARLIKTLRNAIPYLVVLAGFAVWRLFFLELPIPDPNAPRLAAALLANPANTLLTLAQTVVRDVAHVLVMTWYSAFSPDLFDLADRFNLLAWGLAAGLGVGLFAVQRRWSAGDERHDLQPVWLGLFAVLAGFAPVWFTSRDLLSGLFADRFALPALLGAALALAGLIGWGLRTRGQQLAVFSVLIALALGAQLRVGNVYRWDWTTQKRFYAQLITRAPGLEADTALMLGGAITGRVNGYVAALAINSVYAAQPQADQVPYWAFDFYQAAASDMGGYLQGQRLRDGIRNLYFDGQSTQSLLVEYQKDEGACVWVLTPADAANYQLSAEMRAAAPGVGLGAIQPETTIAWDTAIFGDFPANTWCVLYERAALAAQLGDWEAVLELDETAQQNDLASIFGYEYLPFIQALAETGDWDQAADLTREGYKKSFQAQAALCALWEGFVERELPPQGQAAAANVFEALDCSGP